MRTHGHDEAAMESKLGTVVRAECFTYSMVYRVRFEDGTTQWVEVERPDWFKGVSSLGTPPVQPNIGDRVEIEYRWDHVNTGVVDWRPSWFKPHIAKVSK